MLAVGLTVANVAQGGLDPLTDGAEAADVGALATDGGVDAAEGAGDAGEDEEAGQSCTTEGGESFTPSTEVLLASGAAVAISSLYVGDKVLATNTKSGKTEAEAVAAVLIHHDTDRYNLKVRDQGKTAVIDTTSNHLFWVPSSRGGRWAKAASLMHGTRCAQRTAAITSS